MDFSQLPPEILAQLQGAGGGPAGGPATLIKLRAGRCVREGTTVTADPSKGWVEVRRDESELIHLLWRDRTTGAVEEDAMVFPGSATMERVAACTTGRVFVVKWTGSSRRVFVWMQEPSESRDEAFLEACNAVFRNAHAPVTGLGGDASGATSLEAMLGSGAAAPSAMDTSSTSSSSSLAPHAAARPSTPPAAAQAPGPATPVRPSLSGPGLVSSPNTSLSVNQSAAYDADNLPPTPPMGGSPSGDVDMSEAETGGSTAAAPAGGALGGLDLASILSNVQAGAGAGGAAAAGGSLFDMNAFQQQQRAVMGPPLRLVMSADNVLPHLDDAAFEQLAPLMPASLQSREHVIAALRSPQVQQCLSSLSEAMNSGEATPQLCAAFGVQQYPAPGVRALLLAIEQAVRARKSE